MVHIVAGEPIRLGGLWRHGFQRRMRLDHAGRRVETVVGNTLETDSPIVMRNVLDEPVDRIEGISAFVGIHPRMLGGTNGPHLDETAARCVATADALRDE